MIAQSCGYKLHKWKYTQQCGLLFMQSYQREKSEQLTVCSLFTKRSLSNGCRLGLLLQVRSALAADIWCQDTPSSWA